MKQKIIFYIISIVTTALLFGCKDKIDLPDQPLENYIQVYMPQAANGAITYNFSTADSIVAPIIYGADYGGLGYPKEDISLTFIVDPKAVDSFNLANNTDYILLPKKSYHLSNSTGIIKKGELTAGPFKINVVTKGDSMPDDISKTYILPVSIQTDAVKINPSLKTSCFLVNIIPTFFDRKDWKVIDFSSEDSTAGNWKAIYAIDGDINTYWHCRWQGTPAIPPHYLTIDMGKSKKILGAGFVDRQDASSGRPMDIQIFVSDDNLTWKQAYTGSLINTADLQKVFFEKYGSGRYVKLQINSSFSSPLTHLAEFYLF